MVAAAIGVSAAAGLAGSAISSSGAKSAAKANAKAANDANQLQWDMYQQQREDQAPWRDTGVNALSQLASGLGIGGYGGSTSQADIEAELRPQFTVAGSGGDEVDQAGFRDAVAREQQRRLAYGQFQKTFGDTEFQGDPGYQFRLQQGQNALQQSAAAQGGLLSGAAAKALSKYNQNFASNEYQNAYNRFTNDQNNRFNRLATLAGVGQTATNQLGNAGQNYTNAANQNTLYSGAARASGYTNQANALGSGLGSLSGAGLAYGFYGNSGNDPYGNYSASTSPVTDYYSGVNGTPLS